MREIQKRTCQDYVMIHKRCVDHAQLVMQVSVRSDGAFGRRIYTLLRFASRMRMLESVPINSGKLTW